MTSCTMKGEQVFLFGHYDSRGGTVAVRAESLGDAFAKYAAWAGWETDAVWVEDYLGRCTLVGAEGIAPGTDLVAPTSNVGRYHGPVVLVHDRPWSPGELPGEDLDGATLIYYSSWPTEGPRWDDDAFGFVIL